MLLLATSMHSVHPLLISSQLTLCKIESINAKIKFKVLLKAWQDPHILAIQVGHIFHYN